MRPAVIEILSWVWTIGAVTVAIWVIAEVGRRFDYHRLRSWPQMGVAILLAAMVVAAYFSWRGR
jgi:hypothetical protein